jgi:DNA-binding NarL/FixJ family response regulator
MNNNEIILIADDHPLFRQALSVMLHARFSTARLLEAETIPELEQVLTQQSVDLLLLDLDIPGAQGFNTLINIRQLYPDLGVIIVSGIEDNDTINKAMYHGAAGFIPKSSTVDNMAHAITRVFAGELYTPLLCDSETTDKAIDDKISLLTPQQNKILLMIGEGLLNKQIAHELGLTESTIKSHTSIIFLKLGVRNRTQAVIALNDMLSARTAFGPTLSL